MGTTTTIRSSVVAEGSCQLKWMGQWNEEGWSIFDNPAIDVAITRTAVGKGGDNWDANIVTTAPEWGH